MDLDIQIDRENHPAIHVPDLSEAQYEGPQVTKFHFPYSHVFLKGQRFANVFIKH